MPQMIPRSLLAILSLYFISTFALGYTFFGSAPGGNGATPTSGQSGSPSSLPIMTPEQFSNKVKSLNQQTQSTLNQEATAIMNKPTPKSSGPVIGSPSQMQNEPSSSTVSSSSPTPSGGSTNTPYTGFGGGQEQGQGQAPAAKPLAPPKAPGGSGGWNIQY